MNLSLLSFAMCNWRRLTTDISVCLLLWNSEIIGQTQVISNFVFLNHTAAQTSCLYIKFPEAKYLSRPFRQLGPSSSLGSELSGLQIIYCLPLWLRHDLFSLPSNRPPNMPRPDLSLRTNQSFPRPYWFGSVEYVRWWAGTFLESMKYNHY